MSNIKLNFYDLNITFKLKVKWYYNIFNANSVNMWLLNIMVNHELFPSGSYQFCRYKSKCYIKCNSNNLV